MSKRDYFCNSGKDPAFLWWEWSITAAGFLLCMLYAAFFLAGAVALSAGATLRLADQAKLETKPETTTIAFPADVLFAFDKAELQPDASVALRRAAAILEDRHVREVTIAGHTDNIGSSAYNQALSERRAAAVYQWLRNTRGFAQVRAHVVGYGAARPSAPNVRPDGDPDPEGQARNRRVEISFDTPS